MSLDAQLLAELEPGGLPILHFYDWARASATYGHFIDLKKHLDLEKVKRYRLALAKRPTGGGVVFHIWDFAFSFLMPADHPACSKNTLENYQFVNGIVLETVAEHLALQPSLIPEPLPALGPQCNHFCMARPTIYDVVYEGKKVAGAAQRRTRQGYLHQGTISLAFPHFGLLKEVLLSQEEVTRAMETYTFAPLGSLSRPDELKRVRVELQRLLEQKFLAKLEAIPL
ncbi:MAG: lipoate--protein ligase family protein [Verrucomicrobiota bacterium]|nr:lipoate--protein ligase family protein [Verrucomicrobiota bacterium]